MSEKVAASFRDMDTNLQEIKEKIASFVKVRNWSQYHNPKNLSMSIAIEASELMEIFQWSSFVDTWDICDSNEITHVKDELADIMIYCLSLANQLNIDVSESIEEKIDKNAIKYPVE